MSRTTKKWARVYYQGVDISGYTRNVGPLVQDYALVGESEPMFDEAVKGVLVGQANISPGTISSVMDTTSGGMHDTFTAQSKGVLSVAVGMQAVPTEGNPVFAGDFEQLQYLGDIGEDVPITLTLSQSANGATLLYDNPWGWLIHAKGAETAANTADAADHDHGAQTAFGGFMVYHLFTSDGTCTLKVQDSSAESNASYSDLLSSGELDASASPASGLVALANTATVERYTRWQLALNSATTATFVISFHRAIR